MRPHVLAAIKENDNGRLSPMLQERMADAIVATVAEVNKQAALAAVRAATHIVQSEPHKGDGK